MSHYTYSKCYSLFICLALPQNNVLVHTVYLHKWTMVLAGLSCNRKVPIKPMCIQVTLSKQRQQ